MSLGALGAGELASWMASFAESLGRHREVINALNVYPVPDGDTGTNMALTLQSVVTEIGELDQGAGLREVGVAISHGSLMGARGNSGVILCQILRGLATGLAGRESVGGSGLATALNESSVQARAGVMRPVEGTMLTVVCDAAAAATAAATRGADLLGVAEDAFSASVESLRRTPELLEMLARASVVDAGGAGIVLLLDALVHVVSGRELLGALPLPAAVVVALARRAGGAPRGSPAPARADDGTTSGERREAEPDLSGLRYEVMYLLDALDEAVVALKEVWAGIGDSIVVVGGDGLWNCHIHTDDIGAAIEAGLDAGRPRQIRVTDLLGQVEEESWVREAASATEEEPAVEPSPVTSVVAVSTGDGIGRIFRSLGVRHVVAGGQSMNPSIAEILAAIDATRSLEVVVLPNNKNILAAASKACEQARKPSFVLATEGIQEGFAALLEYDPEETAASNLETMAAAAARVVAGEVTAAVRGSETTAGSVEAGDFIGLSRHGIEVIAPSPAEATCALLAKLLEASHEIVTLIEGAGSSAAETRRITEWLAEHYPAVAVELHHGGQPLYPYLVSAE
ncbi:MAG: DAK2 domain-containing protein [Acidimicrobiales bacterium]